MMMNTLHTLVSPALLSMGVISAVTIQSVRSDNDSFELRIRPLLVAKCGGCHGGAAPQSGLRTDSLQSLLKGGSRGPALVVGKPELSLIVQSINRSHPTLRMPPNATLDPKDIAAVDSWIKAGAVWPSTASKPKTAKPLWSVQPVQRPALPVVKTSLVRNPIDRFILSRLADQKLTAAPEADRRTHIRRLSFDLTGLPPTMLEVRQFIGDKRSDAYERLVDRLLASPRYGERWARYWLDLVRYADTNGYERDAEKPESWRYRDYVINSLNTDKPYNRFVTEQLAGDEMSGNSEETWTATGFLRLGTWDDEPNDPLQYKYERLDDLVHTSASAFIGLTVRCARCHDHKFDAIPQRDYYAFAAAFWGGYLNPAERELQGGPPHKRLTFPVLAFTEQGSSPPPIHLLRNGDPRREEDVVPPGFPSMVKNLRQTAEPPPTGSPTSTRRLQLAKWITDPRNPLTSRVIVNRIWAGHFGSGIVATLNNFGVKCAPPTHPELLDWLASEFIAEPSKNDPAGCGWSLKKLHKLIVMSATYRMASVHPRQTEFEKKDYLDRWLWRFPRKRLDADSLRDSLLAVSGELDVKQGGRGFVPSVSREALEGLSRKGAEWSPSPPAEQRRRSIYMFLKRALIMPLMSTFDFGDTTAPMEQRDVNIVAPQALALLNNKLVTDLSDSFARRLCQVSGTPERRVQEAFEIALQRSPSAEELRVSLKMVQQLNVQPHTSKSTASIPGDAVLWLRADQGVEADMDGRVLNWKSSKGSHFATQNDETARPRFEASGDGGKPALRFDGFGTFMKLDSGILRSGAFTMITVSTDDYGNSSSFGHREIISNWRREDNIGTALFFGLTNGGAVRLSDAFAPAGVVENPKRPFALTAVADSLGVAVYQDRHEIARQQSALPTRKLDTPWVIGQQGNIRGEYWKGTISEIIVFDRALSDGELQAVWDDLNHRYGVAVRQAKVEPGFAALCHALFNTNEFLFVD